MGISKEELYYYLNQEICAMTDYPKDIDEDSLEVIVEMVETYIRNKECI